MTSRTKTTSSSAELSALKSAAFDLSPEPAMVIDRDGALIASMLDPWPIRVGAEWWVKGRRWDGAVARPPGAVPTYQGHDRGKSHRKLLGWQRRPSDSGWYLGAVVALHERSFDVVVPCGEGSDGEEGGGAGTPLVPSWVPRSANIMMLAEAASPKLLKRQALASLFRAPLSSELCLSSERMACSTGT